MVADDTLVDADCETGIVADGVEIGIVADGVEAGIVADGVGIIADGVGIVADCVGIVADGVKGAALRGLEGWLAGLIEIKLKFKAGLIEIILLNVITHISHLLQQLFHISKLLSQLIMCVIIFTSFNTVYGPVIVKYG